MSPSIRGRLHAANQASQPHQEWRSGIEARPSNEALERVYEAFEALRQATDPETRIEILRPARRTERTVRHVDNMRRIPLIGRAIGATIGAYTVDRGPFTLSEYTSGTNNPSTLQHYWEVEDTTEGWMVPRLTATQPALPRGYESERDPAAPMTPPLYRLDPNVPNPQNIKGVVFAADGRSWEHGHIAYGTEVPTVGVALHNDGSTDRAIDHQSAARQQSIMKSLQYMAENPIE